MSEANRCQPRARSTSPRGGLALALALALLPTVGASLLAEESAWPETGAPPLEGYRLVDTWTSRQPETTLPQFQEPAGLDVAPDDTILVVDRRARMLYRITSDAHIQGSWPTDAATGRPRDVAVLDQWVYVIGDQGGEIRTLDGELRHNFSTGGALAIAAGPNRRLYTSRLELVGGQPSAIIDVLDVDGNRLESWQPQLPIRSAFGLDVSPTGQVYLAADGGVYRFEAGRVTGLLRLAPSVEGPDVLDVAVDDRGRVFAVQNNLFAAWDPATNSYLGDVPAPGARWLAAGPGVGLVFSIQTLDFTGLAYLPDRSEFTGPLVRWGDVAETLGQLHHPRRLATASQVFILDALASSDRIQRWTSDGRPLEQWERVTMTDVVAGGLHPCYLHGPSITCLGPADTDGWTRTPAPDGWLVAADGNGSLIAALDVASQQVWVLDQDGNPVTDWSVATDDTYAAVTDIAMGSDRVYLADRSSLSVRVHTLDGQLLETRRLPTAALRLATAEGQLYVLARDGWIWKYNETGQVVAVWRPLPESVPADIAAGAGGRVYVADPDGSEEAAEGRILVFAPGGVPGSLPPPPPADRCSIHLDKRASPPVVHVGETVTVQLLTSGRCPPSEGRIDVVLILDRSGSMRGRALAAAQSAAITFVNELDPAGAQVGVVAFSDQAQLLQSLSGDLQAAVRAVARLSAEGQTRYVAALELARAQLTGPVSRAGVPHIAIMMTDGKPTDGPLVLDAARRLKAAGVTLYTVGLGKQPDEDMLRQMASEESLFYLAPDETELAAIYTDIARRLTASYILHRATVTDELPQDMQLVPGSPLPPARVEGRTLVWQLTDVRATGQMLSYQVRPRQPGLRPTNLRAVLDYLDTVGQSGQQEYPVPVIEVLPRTHWETYLPVAWKNRCRPQRADVVLVFDASSSMTAPARAGSGQTKLQAALQAGRLFLDAMALPGDQAAIVSFHHTASLVQPLTGSRAALEMALARVSSDAGTRIDLGLQAATTELLSPRHIATNNPVIILLTDGQPTPGYDTAALVEARVARTFGYLIFAIGLGQDADLSLLLRITSAASQVEFAPDADALEAIYERIAGKVLCD